MYPSKGELVISRFLFLAALLGALVLQPTHVVAAQAQCQGLTGYFNELDQDLEDGFLPLVTDEQWRAQLEASLTKASQSEMSFLILNVEEMEPLIQLVAVPGTVLSTFPEDAIPIVALELHQSADGLWQIVPSLLRTVASEGPLAAVPYVEEISEAQDANLKAQEEIQAACPAEVEALRATAESADEANEESSIPLPSLEDDGFEGASYDILFLLDDDEDAGSTPAAD